MQPQQVAWPWQAHQQYYIKELISLYRIINPPEEDQLICLFLLNLVTLHLIQPRCSNIFVKYWIVTTFYTNTLHISYLMDFADV